MILYKGHAYIYINTSFFINLAKICKIYFNESDILQNTFFTISYALSASAFTV